MLKLKNNHAKYIERGLVYFSTEYATRSRDKSLVTNYGSGLEIFAQVALKNGAVLEYLPGVKGMRTRLYVRLEALPGPEEDFVVEWQSSGKGQHKAAILPVEKSDLLYAPGRIEAPVAVRGGLGTEEQPRMTGRTIRTEITEDGARMVLRDKPPAEMRKSVLSGPAPESKGYLENRSVAPREEVGLSIVDRSSLTAKENLPYNEKDKRLTINDERAILKEATKALKGYPVNMPVDISLIPRGGEADGQLEENIETLARLMAWHHMSGLDVRYALVDSDEDYRAKALGLLKEKLTRLAAGPALGSM